MASPLSLFRKYQKALLAVFGVMIMFAFIVVPSVMEYLQSSQVAAIRQNDVVVTWAGGKVDETQLIQFRVLREATIGFLDAVVAETYRRDPNAQPKAPGVRRGQDGRTTHGISPFFDEESLIRTKLLAEKGRRLGIVVSDDAVLQYLDELSDHVLPRSEIDNLAAQAVGNRLTRAQLFEHLRVELLAQDMAMIGLSGAQSLTPAMAREYYDRLNRSVKLDVLPIKVEDFVSQVKAAPSEAELREMYNEFKYNNPDPSLPEPGFSIPRKLAFQYVKIDFDKYLEEEKAKLTEEQVVAYYEENKSMFRISDPPPSDSPDSAAPAADRPEGAAQPPADGEEKADTTPTESPQATPPAEPAPPDGDQNEPAEPAESAPAKETTSGAPATENEQNNPPAADDNQGAAQRAATATQFVSAQADEEQPAESSAPQQSQADDEPPADAAASDSPEQSAPPAEAPSAPAANDPQAPAAAAADAAADAETSEQPTEKEAPGESEAAAAAEPKYEPLETARERIEDILASRPAQQRVDEAIDRIRKLSASYFPKFAKWRALSQSDSSLPRPEFEIASLAAELGVTLDETPLATIFEIGQYEISEASQFSFAGQQFREIPFAEIAYNDQSPLYKVNQMRSTNDIIYVYWKIDEQEPRTPAFSEVRDQVVLAWKRKQALQLARQAAADRIEQAKKSGAALRDEFNDDMDSGPVVATNSFTWMSRGSTPFASFSMPTISQVEGVEGVGRDFMQAVYALKPGDMGVAVNHPQTIVYAVQLIEQSPSEQELRENFVASRGAGDVNFLALLDRQRLSQEWFEDLEDELKVVWNRERQNRELR